MQLNHIYQGDALDILRTLPDASIHTCVTSPPYWGLRDYGVDGQIGLEQSPDEYVAHLVSVFAEVRRVLRDDGTLWLNLGDSYSTSGGHTKHGENAKVGNTKNDIQVGVKRIVDGLKNKDLIGIPFRVAFALQADGWYLRSDIVWHKPNAMPESVRDRPTKAHEYIFLLSKSQKYYYDYGSIREPMQGDGRKRGSAGGKRANVFENHATYSGRTWDDAEDRLRNRRTVWSVSTKSFKEAHFATFPPALIEPCILAGSPEGGLVLDPFMGSGTTALVARQHNRDYIGIELNPDYIAIAERRLGATSV